MVGAATSNHLIPIAVSWLLTAALAAPPEEERLNVVETVDPHRPETLDLREHDVRDPAPCDVEGRSVVREVDDRRRRDCRQRIVRREQRHGPWTVGNALRASREHRRPDVLRDRHCDLVGVLPVDAGRGLRRYRRSEGRLTGWRGHDHLPSAGCAGGSQDTSEGEHERDGCGRRDDARTKEETRRSEHDSDSFRRDLEGRNPDGAAPAPRAGRRVLWASITVRGAAPRHHVLACTIYVRISRPSGPGAEVETTPVW